MAIFTPLPPDPRSKHIHRPESRPGRRQQQHRQNNARWTGLEPRDNIINLVNNVLTDPQSNIIVHTRNSGSPSPLLPRLAGSGVQSTRRSCNRVVVRSAGRSPASQTLCTGWRCVVNTHHDIDKRFTSSRSRGLMKLFHSSPNFLDHFPLFLLRITLR